MARLDSFLRIVAEQQASDLHFHSGSVPVIRHDGGLLDVPFRVLSPAETQRFLWEILDEEQRKTLVRERQLDFLYVIPNVGRFRANVFNQSQGLGAVFRIIPSEPPRLDALGLPPVLKHFARL